MNRALVGGALAVGLTIGGFGGHLALASGNETTHTFYACVKQGSMIPGSLVVDTPPTCRGGAQVASWNNAGRQGPVGPQGASGPGGPGGPAGPTGPAGTAGPTGATGSAGTPGPAGATGPAGVVGATGATGSAGTPGPTGPPGPAGAGVKTISGLVSATGSLSIGTGVTVLHLSTGTYLLQFPVGTWASFPAIIVSPFGRPGFFPVAEIDSVIAPSNGSATALVVVSSTTGTFTPADAAFLFTVTAT
jgi:hypothetical protein